MTRMLGERGDGWGRDALKGRQGAQYLLLLTLVRYMPMPSWRLGFLLIG